LRESATMRFPSLSKWNPSGRPGPSCASGASSSWYWSCWVSLVSPECRCGCACHTWLYLSTMTRRPSGATVTLSAGGSSM
jgi:hypothetical protein